MPHRVVGLLTLALMTCLLSSAQGAPFAHVEFLTPPEIFTRHHERDAFSGPSVAQLADGDLLMSAPLGREPADFKERHETLLLPMLYRSHDRGLTWTEWKRFSCAWTLDGVPSYGGLSFLRLRDGRLAAVFNHNTGHGGGVPALTFSSDDGANWTEARQLTPRNDIYYVMNDRLIQLRSGRLVLPVSHKQGAREGDHDECLAYLSDDAGATWRPAKNAVTLAAFRGMAEPCVVELHDGRLLMLARTGSGSHHRSISRDGGETWSAPEPTTLIAGCSPLTLYRLPDSRLIVFYNHAPALPGGSLFPRAPLVCATSSDEGTTWSAPLIIDDEGVPPVHGETRQHIYPSATFLPEGILLLYSTHYARDEAEFRLPPDSWKIGGGKRCVFKYPPVLAASR